MPTTTVSLASSSASPAVLLPVDPYRRADPAVRGEVGIPRACKLASSPSRHCTVRLPRLLDGRAVVIHVGLVSRSCHATFSPRAGEDRSFAGTACALTCVCACWRRGPGGKTAASAASGPKKWCSSVLNHFSHLMDRILNLLPLGQRQGAHGSAQTRRLNRRRKMRPATCKSQGGRCRNGGPNADRCSLGEPHGAG
jgi:hypothetical protein